MAANSQYLFLSTPSARRATVAFMPAGERPNNFYPRPPRGGRLKLISFKATLYRFLSTPSARRATLFLPTSTSSGRISIHALREEGDTWATSPSMVLTNFYPRPPRGGRRVFDDIQRSHDLFLSTPSARRATLCRVRHQATPLHFYPRPPRGGRLHALARLDLAGSISIHALREEGDLCSSLL